VLLGFAKTVRNRIDELTESISEGTRKSLAAELDRLIGYFRNQHADFEKKLNETIETVKQELETVRERITQFEKDLSENDVLKKRKVNKEKGIQRKKG